MHIDQSTPTFRIIFSGHCLSMALHSNAVKVTSKTKQNPHFINSVLLGNEPYERQTSIRL